MGNSIKKSFSLKVQNNAKIKKIGVIGIMLRGLLNVVFISFMISSVLVVFVINW
jgi:hypothetical protein